VDFVHQLADGKLSNIVESDGAGGAVLDYDGDGFIDIYFVNSGPAPIISDAPPGTPRQPNRLYRNRGDGTFEDMTRKAGVEGHGFGITAAAADYDNDGDTDLYVVNYGGGILYSNQGNGTFKDVTLQSGVTTRGGGISATFLDYDGDGFLDLFVANYLTFDPKVKSPPGSSAPYPGPLSYEAEFNALYRNRGDGTFEDVSERTGISLPGHRAMSVTSFDYDLDGDPDIYVSNDATPNLLLANDGKGHFKDVGLLAGAAFNQFGEAPGSMGAAVADANGDGLPDMFVTRFGNASLYLNSKGGFFEDRIQASGILDLSSKYTGWGGNFFDFDNDGDADLLIVNGDAHFLKGMPTLLFENRGNGVFSDASAKGGPFLKTLLNARGSGVADFDNDGRVDVIITTLGGRAVLLKNRGAASRWLGLKLEGTRRNRDGFGAQVRVISGGRVQYAESRCPTSYVFQQDARLHFGLGGQARAERIEIRWPGGQTQTLTNVAADQVLKVREPGESR
jgi:enediyne biosynthesis protein E4